MAPEPDHQPDRVQIQQAILQTLVYGDLFNYPLSPDEIVRYLTVPAPHEVVRDLLEAGTREGLFQRANGYFTLAGRLDLVPLRERREQIARTKWATAERYARWIARMPFVRMIAVTGTLAVRNVEADDDIDLFIVTAPGRLWLCRAFVILVVRVAALRGEELCPNYFLSERELKLEERNFFNARELAQMIPLYGDDTYQQIWSLNGWVKEYLPQAEGAPENRPLLQLGPVERRVKHTMERWLGGRLGAWLDRWEMNRKIRKFGRRAQTAGGTARFTPDCCKGHFDRHEEIILRMFEERLAAYSPADDSEH